MAGTTKRFTYLLIFSPPGLPQPSPACRDIPKRVLTFPQLAPACTPRGKPCPAMSRQPQPGPVPHHAPRPHGARVRAWCTVHVMGGARGGDMENGAEFPAANRYSLSSPLLRPCHASCHTYQPLRGRRSVLRRPQAEKLKETQEKQAGTTRKACHRRAKVTAVA
ncbi:hypothetical protein E2C01_074125 [Portunus trituberculatus]|uniref:Uncharacterized protein n=1 Tax=Portunus trituberculatus TaxID=210409 RepID=A0A5B7I4W7_PORTR|nr:hypothetical protein [Portunus trituberculatus]